MCNSVCVLMTMLVASVSLASIAYADDGTVSFYTRPYTPSACNGNQNDGVMIAAAGDAMWNNSAACGQIYSLTCVGPKNGGNPQPCTGQTVTVTIVDNCSGCKDTLALSQEAFAVIAKLDAGVVEVDFKLN